MKKRIAEKMVNGNILPAIAPFVAAGGGIGSNSACYSDRERQACRIFVRRKGKVSKIYTEVKPNGQ